MTEIYSEKYSFQKSSERTRGNKGLLAVSWEHKNEKVRVKQMMNTANLIMLFVVCKHFRNKTKVSALNYI